jgi:deoxyribodipyrimidine photo-lyase
MAAPILLWLRRDLRLADHPAMTAAAEAGRPVIPVFILDEVMEGHGPVRSGGSGLAPRRWPRG